MSAMEIPKPKWKGSRSLIHELHSPLHSLTNNYASALCNNYHKYLHSPYFTSGKDPVEEAVLVLVYDCLREVEWLCLLQGKERALKQNINKQKQTNKTWTNLPSVFASQLAGWWCSSLQLSSRGCHLGSPCRWWADMQQLSCWTGIPKLGTRDSLTGVVSLCTDYNWVSDSERTLQGS